MRKLIAALLLCIYLLNVGGQLVLHQYLSSRSEKFFIAQTSKGLYNKNDLTEVKLPVNMPGITDWVNYEDIKGCIQFNDVSYNYVKMKLTSTALYLMCVPDYSTTRLLHQNVIDARQSKGMPVQKKNHVPYGKANSLGNFSIAFAQFSFSSIITSLSGPRVHTSQALLTLYRDIPRQPPKYSC